ncbi:hypothetical protein [Emticicia sp. 17c]|uniref:hypothetical protein n=1 Tax=Emticicia sp. 17c TaxID=3127704 RepID=UPI00301C158D
MKNSRFVYSLFTSFFLASLLVSCGGSETKKPDNQANSPSIHTLIFIDKTASVDVQKPFVEQKYKQALTSIIEENFRKSGDTFEIYYIHENTSKARTLSLVCRTEMEDTEGVNATDLEAIKTSYDLSIRKERNYVLQQSFNRLKTQNNDASNLETNITASIPVIAKVAEIPGNVKVYYLSDMVESVKKGRDFQIRPPKDDTEAEEWAKIDADKLKNFQLNGPDISMILPFEPTSSSKENNPTVTHYWQKLFESLGAMSVTEM